MAGNSTLKYFYRRFCCNNCQQLGKACNENTICCSRQMLCPCLKCAHTSCMESFCLDILLVLDPRILGHARQPVCKLCLDLEHTQHVHKLYGWIHLLRVNFHSPVHPGAPLVVLSQSWVGGRPECVGVSSRTHGAQNRHYAEKRRRPWATEGWSSVMVWRTSRWTEKQDVNVIN